MAIPLDWLVLFFFIILIVIFFVVYEINSKFKWKERAFELEDKIQELTIKLSSPSNIKNDLKEIIADIKNELTIRQFEIFVYTIEGLSSKEIADILNIAPTSVDSHIKEICKKLNVQKRTQLAGVFLAKLKSKSDVESLFNL